MARAVNTLLALGASPAGALDVAIQHGNLGIARSLLPHVNWLQELGQELEAAAEKEDGSQYGSGGFSKSTLGALLEPFSPMAGTSKHLRSWTERAHWTERVHERRSGVMPDTPQHKMHSLHRQHTPRGLPQQPRRRSIQMLRDTQHAREHAREYRVSAFELIKLVADVSHDEADSKLIGTTVGDTALFMGPEATLCAHCPDLPHCRLCHTAGSASPLPRPCLALPRPASPRLAPPRIEPLRAAALARFGHARAPCFTRPPPPAHCPRIMPHDTLRVAPPWPIPCLACPCPHASHLIHLIGCCV